jgi:hypothetical protein
MVKKLFATRGSRNSKTRAREGGASVFTFFSFLFFVSAPPPPEKIAGGFQQAGKKEGGLGEGIFARLLISAPKARLGWERLSFVQKRFEQCSVIATNKDILKIGKDWIARSPRLRRGSLRKNPFVWRLNQTAGEARRGLVLKAGGGSELRSNLQIKFVSNFFLSAFGGIRSQFLIPRFMAKGD